MAPTVGATGSKAFTVTDADTAIAMGSGDVAVLGTPRLLAWLEEVTVLALAPGLEDGMTSVGYRIHVDHLAPTPVGAEVEVTATISAVDGRQVTFDVSATDPKAAVAGGSIVRVVVDRERFTAKATGA